MPGKTRMHDRHRIPAPAEGATVTPTGTPILTEKAYLDGLKERIHELFLTLPHLPGHVRQVQQELNRLSNSNLSAFSKEAVASAAFEQIRKAAEHCTIEFPLQTFQVASIQKEFVITRQDGLVVGYKRPTA
jgi:hypothetical protein